MSKMNNLNQLAAKGEMFVRSYSPGNGARIYRFFYMGVDARQGYSGPENGIYTAMGIKEATIFATGASLRKCQS